MNRPLTSELIAQLQSGETTSRQLVENSLRRISELNGVLNAFVSIDADGIVNGGNIGFRKLNIECRADDLRNATHIFSSADGHFRNGCHDVVSILS